MTYFVLAPKTNSTYVAASGTAYVSDNNGIITGIATVADLQSLQSVGCIQLVPQPGNLIAKLLGANFNSTADQVLTLFANSKYRVTKVTVENASLSLTTAAGGFYNQASKAGTPLVAATQAYTALTTPALALDCTLNEPNAVLPALTPIYLSLTTAQGVAATADVFVYGDLYPAN